MTKKGLEALLSNAGIIKAREISDQDLHNYDPTTIYQGWNGKNYILDDNELNQNEENTALLAQISIGIKSLRNVCIFIGVIAVINLFVLLMIFFGIK